MSVTFYDIAKLIAENQKEAEDKLTELIFKSPGYSMSIIELIVMILEIEAQNIINQDRYKEGMAIKSITSKLKMIAKRAISKKQ